MMALCFYPELNVRKISIFFKILKYMQSGCYGDFAPILECRTLIKCGFTRELSVMINLHLT